MNMLFTRRTVRSFLDKPVEREKIEKLLEAAMQAPTAGNGQLQRYIVVEDPEMCQKLAKCHQYATPAAKALLNIVVVADTKEGRFPQYWQQDCSNACMNILHQAVELGLGGVWLGTSPEEDRMQYISDLFNLPEYIKPFAVLPIGYPDKENAHHFVSRFDSSKIHWGKW
ncbi:MAG: nitroreductase family protein [Brevinema sp.]